MSTGRRRSRTPPKEVTRSKPCAVCNGHSMCKRCEDGLLICGRHTGPAFGFVYLGQAKGDVQFALYRQDDDPVVREREEEYQRNRQNAGADFKGKARGRSASSPPPPETNGHTKDHTNGAQPSLIDWEVEAQKYAAQLTPALRGELAKDLGLPLNCLDALSLIGWNPSNVDRDDESQPWAVMPCWTFPERDATGRIVGLMRRRRDGRKKRVTGSKSGLIIPERWRDHDGPIYLPEGHSDVLAATALGLCSIGRPNNVGGVSLLAELLAGVPSERPIVVLAEYDPKPNPDYSLIVE